METWTSEMIDWQSLSKAFGLRLRRDVPLARYTASRVGGPADGFIEVRSATDLNSTIQELWALHTPFIILGGGSNILVSDLGIRAVVLMNRSRHIHFKTSVERPEVWAESGVNFGALARQTALRNLAGLEWAAGIPGTLGGAIYGNAGAHGSDMASSLIMAEILHQDGLTETWSAEKFGFHYRGSNLKKFNYSSDLPGSQSISPSIVVLSARLRLQRDTREQIQERIDTYLAHRRRTQPPGASMGSMFKNPPGDYAGRLIETAGLKGMRIGDAQISSLHANFFINLGKATATDIRSLIDLARRRVLEMTGIELDLEIELVGQW